MDSVLIGDLVRVVALIVGAGALAVAGVVTWTYAVEYRLSLVTARGPQDKWRGLLPRHVVLIGTSYFGLVLFTLWTVVWPLVHEPLSWRGPTLLLLYAAGLWAMWDILGHQRHRKHARRRVEEFGRGRHRQIRPPR